MENEQYTFKAQFLRRTYPKHKPSPGDYQVVKMKVLGRDFKMPKEITLVGEMICMDTKTTYEIIAEKGYHPIHGVNYTSKIVKEIRDFSTEENVRNFLTLFLNEKQINSLYNITNNPIELLDSRDIDSLCRAKGIGTKTAQKMIDRYYETKDCSVAYEKMIVDYGLSPAIIGRIIKHYDDSPDLALSKLEENPYYMTEVDGIGFIKADEIALKMGVDKLDSRRLQAYILYYLDEVGNADGHSYVYYENILDNVDEYLKEPVDQSLVDNELQKLIDKKKLHYIDTEDALLIASRKVYETEKSINCNLKRLMSAKSNIPLDEDSIDILLKPQERKQGWNFTEKQKLGIKKIIKHNVVIIRGYGGTGKSSTVAGVLSCLGSSYKFHQCALSGKASVNLRDITGQNGSTIHSLLGYKPKGGYVYNEENQLDTNMVILDEASMPNIFLLNALLKAIPTGAKLILLGDTNQLEAIGVGNALLDMIDSGIIPTVTFDEIHRQSAKSGIIPFSIDVAKGITMFKKDWYGEKTLGVIQDFKLIGYQYDKDDGLPRPSSDYILDGFDELYEECNHNISQIAVILPSKQGNTGCITINKMIQDCVLPQNKRTDFIEVNGYKIYKGDKVINTKNNYEVIPRIYNGNMGEVIEVDSDRRMLKINFYNIGEVTLFKDDLKSIELGYAITTHKSQGSTIPYVISCVDYSHYVMLNKQQVYTMITRAKKKEIFIFETRALNHAIRTDNAKKRRTFLYFFLVGEL